MTRGYFRLDDDIYLEPRWHLGDLCDGTGVELDSREFRYGNYVDPGPPLKCSMWNEDTVVDVKPPLKWTWSREGTPLDFTYSDECAPVVTERVGNLLAKFAAHDIQRFPVRVERMEGNYEIINVATCIDCIDTERSEIDWYEEGNPIRPDLAGSPKLITKLVIDPNRVGGHEIFRPEGWEVVIVVSDIVKEAFEEAGVTGVKFVSVT